MTAIVITATASATPATFLADLATGTILVHKERDNGTTRRLHFLVEGTEAREVAEFVEAMRDQDEPWSMKRIAAELHLSVAATRRALNDLILTREFEEMDAEEIEALLLGGSEDEPAEETTPAAEPFVCDWEGHDTATDEHGFCPVCQ